MADFATIVTAWARKATSECPKLSLLIIGTTGVGKSTLVNNLLLEKVVPPGDTLNSETKTITKYERSVNGVPVVVYDTPGLGDSRCVKDEKYLQEIRKLIDKEKIALVIYCTKMSETRIHQGLLDTFRAYNDNGIDWSCSVIALTFANCVPVPYEIKKDSNSKLSDFFNAKLTEWREKIPEKLLKEGLKPEVVQKIQIIPAASHHKEKIYGVEWYIPFWLGVIETLPTVQMLKYLEIHKDNVTCADDNRQQSQESQPLLLDAVNQKSTASDNLPISVSMTSADSQAKVTAQSSQADMLAATKALSLNQDNGNVKLDQEIASTDNPSANPSTATSEHSREVCDDQSTKVCTDTLAPSNCKPLTLNSEQRETLNEIVGKKIVTIIADTCTGGAFGASFTTAAAAAAATAIIAGTPRAPVLIPALAVGTAAGAISRWLGWW